MDLELHLAESWFPDSWTVLGRRLAPMTLGHALLLTRLKNWWAPFRKTVSTPTRLDLLQGIYVCSRPWNTAAAGLGRLRTGLVWRYWGWLLRRCGGHHEATAALAFDGYAACQTEIPPLWIKERQEHRRGTAPVLQSVCAWCLNHGGANQDSVLDQRLRLALWGMAGFAEANGSVDFRTPEETALLSIQD